MNLFGLKGRVAIVSGASSGLGADAARAYAEYGADVALLARRKDRLDELAKELTKKGVRALPIACDVTDENQVKSAVEQVIKHFGKIDILLNNAGVVAGRAVENVTEEEWDKTFNVNVKGIFLMSKHVIPHMRERKYGKIVNIASVYADIAQKSIESAVHPYNASKAAVKGLTMAMAASYGPDNITVNSIKPGLFATEMTTGMFEHEAVVKAYNDHTPMGRPGKQGELDGTILYLSSEASSYVTGQHIAVDGGYTTI